VCCLDLLDLHQRLLDPLLVFEAHRQEVAPGAPLPGPLLEAGGSDLVGDVVSLGEELRKIVARPRGLVLLVKWKYALSY